MLELPFLSIITLLLQLLHGLSASGDIGKIMISTFPDTNFIQFGLVIKKLFKPEVGVVHLVSLRR